MFAIPVSLLGSCMVPTLCILSFIGHPNRQTESAQFSICTRAWWIWPSPNATTTVYNFYFERLCLCCSKTVQPWVLYGLVSERRWRLKFRIRLRGVDASVFPLMVVWKGVFFCAACERFWRFSTLCPLCLSYFGCFWCLASSPCVLMLLLLAASASSCPVARSCTFLKSQHNQTIYIQELSSRQEEDRKGIAIEGAFPE